eukprot:gene5734-6633_t
MSRLKGMGTIRGLTPPTQRKSYYQHLHHIIRTSNRYSTRFQSIPEIDKDIARTFPGHPFFESVEGQRKLTRVLQAYSVRNRKVGYCQSMNIVAGYLLYVMKKNEEDAFWLLATIVEDYCQNYYSTNLLGAQVDMIVFDHLVKSHLPNLYGHLQNYSVSLTLLSTKWFMCLYIGILPNEIVLRIWDHLFVECGIYGFHKPTEEAQWLENRDPESKCLGFASYNLLLTGLAILSYMEEGLLKCHSTPLILTLLSKNVKGIFNAKKFFKKYCHWRDKIQEDGFMELKKDSEISLINELEEMRKVRDLTATAKITRFSKTDLEKIWTGFRNLNMGISNSRISMGKSLKLDFGIFKKVFSYILPGIDPSSKDVLVQQLFKVFDKNKDGSLDFGELMSGLCILAKGTSEERLQIYFSFFDSDNSGYVSKEEMKLMLQTVYEKIEMDPLAVTEYTIDEYVDIVFSNLGVTSLSFDNFRQAILSYPRIFRCFMLEEETFIIGEFEDIDEDGQPKVEVTTDETETQADGGEQQDDTKLDDGGEPIYSLKKSRSKLNFQSKPLMNHLKTSTFKSSLIHAIEAAKKDQDEAQLQQQQQLEQQQQQQHQQQLANEASAAAAMAAASEDGASETPGGNAPSPNLKSSDTTVPPRKDGQPLSCCKFM